MFFSRKEDYGVLLMKELAQNYKNHQWLSLREISEKYNLPLPFLKQLARKLKKSDLLLSKEGKHGGYKLSRDPKKISIGDVIRALSGPVGFTYCLTENRTLNCDKENKCPSRSTLKRVGEEFILKLDSIKLA